ncbi:MAG: tRNA lysidine(34) synthetase TilS [Nitrospirota bacterium]
MDLIQKVHKTILGYSMLSGKDHVLIGLSGGPDSVCLAIVMDRLKTEFNLSLSAVYIDHGLRPDEIKGEIDFCKRFCDDRQIDFYSRSVDVRTYVRDKGSNVQQAARELRYRVYEEMANQVGASKIVLGHNADDQAETVLMRLLRGSGRKGLSGIPPVRSEIIRPLIDCSRKEIEDFISDVRAIHESSLNYVVDSSNLKEDYFRNWIRLKFMDEIKTRNPSVIHDICRTADIIREEDDYLEIVVTKTLMRLISRKSDSSIELFLVPLGTIEKPVLRRVLRRAIDAVKGLRGIDFVHVEDIMKLIKKGRSGDRLDLPKGIRVIKDYSLLKISTEEPARIGEYELQPSSEVQIREAGIRLKAVVDAELQQETDGKTEALFDADAVRFPLKIRPRFEGDFFYPSGFGKRKKLQDFFVDEKVPRDERDRVPIVLSENDIIWIAGYRADDRFKVTGKTENILRLIIIENDNKKSN